MPNRLGRLREHCDQKQATKVRKRLVREAGGDAQGCKTREVDGDLEVLSLSERIRTIDDALRYAEVDTAVWYVADSECTAYESPMKVRSFAEDGKPLSDKPTVIKLWRIKLRLKRRVPKPFAEAAEALIARMAKHAPRYPSKFARPKLRGAAHMLEVSIFDAHFGKLAWKPETGEDFDLDIIERVYLDACEDLLERASGNRIERILYPVGQDFFHIDGPKGQTTSGTQVDHDGRFTKIFETGVTACVRAIDRMLEVAPVEVLWVPGNHDRVASYHLASYLKAWYRHCSRVTVDCEPKVRKFVRYGRTVIGFTHGDQGKLDRLPAVFLHEARQLMAEADSLEIHLGHFHKAKETVYVNTDTLAGGVRVRILPSLSGTDYWHYGMGYVGSLRAAEAYLWSHGGYEAHYCARVRETKKGVA